LSLITAILPDGNAWFAAVADDILWVLGTAASSKIKGKAELTTQASIVSSDA
jgi:hypothetical protein